MLIKKDIKQIIRFLRQFAIMILFICILGMIMSFTESLGVTLVIPLLQGVGGTGGNPLPFPFNKIVGAFSGIELKTRVQVVALLMLAIVSLKGFLSYVNNILSFRLQQDTIKYYRMLCFKQLMRVKMGYFNAQRFGSIQSLITMNTQYAGGLIYHCVMLIPSFFTVTIFVLMLFFLSWKMSIFAIPLVILVSFFLRKISHKTSVAGKATDLAFQDMNSTLLDMLSGMKIVRLFNREKDMVDKFNKDIDKVKETVFNLDKTKAKVTPIYEFTGVACLAFIMISGSFVLGRYEKFSLELLLVFIFIFYRLMSMATTFNTLRVGIIGYLPFLNRVHRFIDETDELYIKNGSKNFTGLRKGIELRNVSFRYNINEKEVLSSVSCFIPKGAKVGIVGHSGGGKSTLTELLLRFYDPREGAIIIDGVDLRELDINSWRRYIGVVTQETFLFNDTVYNNIAFAKPGVSREEIDKAVYGAHADLFIRELPYGYDTVLGERGVRLSGGQKQRIAIARAILTNPEILVFDEATSSLDTESERIVQEALNEVGEGKTVITIAHRLSTISDADLIFVVVNGSIVEQGTHQELLKLEGVYKNLVALQNLEN